MVLMQQFPTLIIFGKLKRFSAYEGWMRYDLQLVQKIEGAHVCHAFLTPLPGATADRSSILFFRATAAV
jgi:hypothetical protein